MGVPATTDACMIVEVQAVTGDRPQGIPLGWTTLMLFTPAATELALRTGEFRLPLFAPPI